MRGKRGFDEVMIVNPSETGSNDYRGAGLMRFHAGPTPGMGYFAEPSDAYGYYAEPPDDYGYYAEPEVYGYYAEPPDAYGYYAEPPDDYGYYAESPDDYGYYAEAPDAYNYYADPSAGYGHYSEYLDPALNGYAQVPGYEAMGYGELPQPYGYYSEDPYQFSQYEPVGYYGQVPEMVGYGQYDPLAVGYAGVGGFGEPDISGYVRQTEPAFNAGCPLPTNVNGLDEAPLDGYTRPAPVSPSCTQFTPQPGEPIPLPDSFKPLW